MAEGVAGTALARGMGCLGRSTLVGGVSGTVAGGFDGAAGYLTGPGPHTVGGFLGATGGGAVFGGFTGAGAGALSSVTNTSRFGCFPAGTRVLMADGTARPIEEVEVGDRIASADPDTGRPATATVTATFTTGTWWTLAHNGCTWDDAAGEWIDTETGKPRTPRASPNSSITVGSTTTTSIDSPPRTGSPISGRRRPIRTGSSTTASDTISARRRRGATDPTSSSGLTSALTTIRP